MDKFDSKYYMDKNPDVLQWFKDGSEAGIQSGSGGVYNKRYNKDTTGWENAWVKGMNKDYGTNHTDMSQFTQDQSALFHYKHQGKNEGRKGYDDSPPPAPVVENKPVTNDSERFAGSDAFQQRLNDSMKPIAGKVDYRYGTGSKKGFESQANKELDFENQRFNQDMQHSDQIFSRYSSANRAAQAGRGDGSSIANKYIRNARNTNPIDIVALDKHIRKTPLYSEAKSQIEGLSIYGDKYKNARENPVSWSQPVPTPGVEAPDFGSIYNKTKYDLNSIKY